MPFFTRTSESPGRLSAPPRRLRDFLTPDQLNEYERTGRVTVVNVHSGNVWEVACMTLTGNIRLMEMGNADSPPLLTVYGVRRDLSRLRPGTRLCVYPVSYNGTAWDEESRELAWAGQILTLTYDEETILKIAYYA